MRRVEQTVAGVSGAAACELGLGKAKRNEVEFRVTRECLVETAPRNALGLNDAGNYHDANSGMELANALHEFDDCFAGVDD